MVERTDETLFACVQHGDHDAFALLVQRYQDRLYRLALNVLHHPQDAQDATQQAFLQLWHKRGSYSTKWRLRTWLYRIVTNICIDEYRRRRRRGPASQETLESLPAPGSPDRDYEILDRRGAVFAALERVPVEARMVLTLCYVEGWSYAEIARVRGVSVHTVKSRLRIAKALLREQLNGLTR